MSDVSDCALQSGLEEVFESVIRDLKNRLAQEVQLLDGKLTAEGVTTEERFRTYTGYFKMVQGVEMMINGIRQQRDEASEKQIEVVEFRRQLEEQISRLVDTEPEKTVPEETG